MHNIKIYHEKISQLSDVVNELLNLAKNERWDELLLEWSRYDSVILNLPTVCWLDLSDSEKSSLEMQLRQIETSNNQLLELTSVWREELQEVLQNSMQSRKLNEHYR